MTNLHEQQNPENEPGVYFSSEDKQSVIVKPRFAWHWFVDGKLVHVGNSFTPLPEHIHSKITYTHLPIIGVRKNKNKVKNTMRHKRKIFFYT